MKRKISHGCNVNVSYAGDGSVVEIMLLEAKAEGLFPIAIDQAAA